MNFDEKMRRRRLLVEWLKVHDEWALMTDGPDFKSEIHTIRPGNIPFDTLENPTAQDVFLTFQVELEALAEIFYKDIRGNRLSYRGLGSCELADDASWQKLANLLGVTLHLYQRVLPGEHLLKASYFPGGMPDSMCSRQIKERNKYRFAI